MSYYDLLRSLLILSHLTVGLLLSAEASSTATPAEQIAQALHNADIDGEGALVQLEALRSLPAPHGTRAAVGAMRVLVSLKRFDEAKNRAAELLADPSLLPAERLETIATRLKIMSATRDWADDTALIAGVDDALLAAAGNDVAARYYQELGGLRVNQMRLPEAESLLLAGLDVIGEPLGNGHISLHRMLGVVYAQQGRYPEAITQMQRHEAVLEALGRPADIPLLLNFGGLYTYLEDWDRAIEYLTRAETLIKADPKADPKHRMRIYSALAGSLAGAAKHPQAYAKFDEALAFAQAQGIEDASVLNNLGYLLQKDGRHREALARFEQVFDILQRTPNPAHVGVAEKNIGQTLLILGESARALEYLLLAEQAQGDKAPRAKRLELLPSLIDALEQNNRPVQALAYMREFKKLSDEVLSAESKERIAELQSVAELERKERELVISEQQGALRAAENLALRAAQQRQQLIIGGTLLTLVAFAIIVALLMHDRRFKARAHAELESRNARIESQRLDLEKLNQALRRQSLEDALTGLNNRHFLTEFMTAARTLGPAGERQVKSLLLIMADLDHFKRINDEHGHLSGDRVLVGFADVLRQVRADRDLLVRWGGEEFIWLCLDATVDDGPARCETLRGALRGLAIQADDGQQIRVTASLGFVALPPWPGIDCPWETALRLADAAIYASKAEGRDRWNGYRGLTPPAVVSADAQPEDLEQAGHVQRVRMPG